MSNHHTIVVGMTQQEASDLQQKLGKAIEKVEAGNVGINAPSPDPVIEQLVAELFDNGVWRWGINSHIAGLYLFYGFS